jgi:hypothetical protein
LDAFIGENDMTAADEWCGATPIEVGVTTEEGPLETKSDCRTAEAITGSVLTYWMSGG